MHRDPSKQSLFLIVPSRPVLYETVRGDIQCGFSSMNWTTPAFRNPKTVSYVKDISLTADALLGSSYFGGGVSKGMTYPVASVLITHSPAFNSFFQKSRTVAECIEPVTIKSLTSSGKNKNNGLDL